MPSPETLREMTADYRRKIELYSSMIAEWEKELGVGGAAEGGPIAGRRHENLSSTIRISSLAGSAHPRCRKGRPHPWRCDSPYEGGQLRYPPAGHRWSCSGWKGPLELRNKRKERERKRERLTRS